MLNLLVALILTIPLRLVVVDAFSGAPLAYAEIRGPDGAVVALAASDGSVALEASSVGFTVNALGFLPAVLPAGFQDGDTVRLERDPIRLEQLVVSVARGEIARTAIAADQIRPNDEISPYRGQEVAEILALRSSVSWVSDSGLGHGYTYFRIRGIDQTRIAVTIDGVPMNEPEDQGFYSSNIPGLLGAIERVDVSPGIAPASYGIAAVGGAVHMQSRRLFSDSAATLVDFSAGPFATMAGSYSAFTGTRDSGFAASGRIAAHQSDGYRHHSGSKSLSWHGSVGRIRATDQIRLTAFGGDSRNDMAYLASSVGDLAVDPRHNPLSEDEVDHFRQVVTSLNYTRALSRSSTAGLLLYNNDISGNYLVLIDGLWRFSLDGSWSGAIATLKSRYAAVDVEGGLHINRYSRDHALDIGSDYSTRLYRNTGKRGEQSGFIRASLPAGPTFLDASVQVRGSTFSYVPDVAGSAIPDWHWLFVNPSVGLRVPFGNEIAAHVQASETEREPTRNDLFGGFDNLGPDEIAFLGDIRRVRPERVRNLQVTFAQEAGGLSWVITGYGMFFHDEIVPVGEISYIGLPLRKNVDRSSRLGLEASIANADPERLHYRIGGSLIRARISEYVDDASGIVYRDVSPLLTPRWSGRTDVTWQADRALKLSVSAEGNSSSLLANDGDARFVAPGFIRASVGATVDLAHGQVFLRLENVTDSKIYRGGYHDGAESYFYPSSPRSIHFVVKMQW